MNEFKSVVDSGRRQLFATGSQRDTNIGKGRFDLLPCAALKRVAQHFENGAAKYEERNWEKGQPLSRYVDSGLRHLFAYLGGAADEDHLAAAAWNILCCIETEHRAQIGLLPKELRDLPNPHVIPKKKNTPEELMEMLTELENIKKECRAK